MVVGNSLRRRGVVIVVLLILQAPNLIQPQAPIYEECSDADCGPFQYEDNIGETVRLHGTIVQKAPPILQIPRPDEPVRLVLRDFDQQAESGQRVVVYGTVRPGHVLRVGDTVVHPPASRQHTRAIGVLAVLLLGLLAIRHWRFDRAKVLFRPREQADG